MEELTALQQESTTYKSIVFSQFVAFLDLIQWRLSRAGFNVVKLDGRMSPIQRDTVIRSFMTDPGITVFLVSLKAGGVALNLTEASRVFGKQGEIVRCFSRRELLNPFSFSHGPMVEPCCRRPGL